MPDTDPVTATKIRAVRVGDLWEEAQDTAREERETVTDVIRLALAAYVADPAGFHAAVATIRGGKR